MIKATHSRLAINRRITLKTAVAGWLLFFVVPFLLLHFSLSFLFRLSQESNSRAAMNSIVSEMGSFQRDLEVTSFLDRKLQSFFSASEGRLDYERPEIILAALQEHSGIKAGGIVCHNADTCDVSYQFDDRLSKSLVGFSRNFLKRFFVALNHQEVHVCISEAGKKNVQNIFRFTDREKLLKDSESAFRRLFLLVAEMPLQPKKTSRSISGKLEDNIFFFYWPEIINKGANKAIRGGSLVIIRGSEISQKAVWRDALTQGNKYFRRSYEFVEQPDVYKGMINRNIISGFRKTDEGLHFLNTASQISMLDLIFRGKFKPTDFEKIVSNMPLLKLTAPKERFKHPLADYAKPIYLACRIILMAGAVLFLNVYFFGLEFKAGINLKVLIGTCVILLPPFLLLFLVFVTRNNFDEIDARYQVEDLNQKVVEDFQKGFNQYLNNLQLEGFRLSSNIEKMAARNNETQLLQTLKDWLDNSIARDIYFDQKGKPTIHLHSEANGVVLDKNEESTRRLMAAAILNAFESSGSFNEVFAAGESRRVDAVDTAFVNNLINRQGRPVSLTSFAEGNRYMNLFTFAENRYTPIGIVSVKLHLTDIVKSYVRYFINNMPFYHRTEVDFYLTDESSGYLRFFHLPDEKELNNNVYQQKLEQAVKSGSLPYRESVEEIRLLRQISGYPLIMSVKGTVPEKTVFNRLLTAVIVGYAAILLFFMFLFLKFIYLEPISGFIEITEKVAAGDYLLNIRKTCSDEFGELQQTFAEMVKGLEQKRQMSRFVSQDVINAVEASDSQMAPGGEKIEACVVFIQLADLNISSSDVSVDELFRQLSRFIAAADHFAAVNGGVIDKIIENTLMLVFRRSHSHDFSHSACRAALAVSEEMRSHGFCVRCGIASGIVVSGRIGSRLGKLDFTVIGDPVNLAARLKAQAVKAVETGIIIAPSTIRALKGRARVVFIDRCEIKGKSREYPLYELTALRS